MTAHVWIPESLLLQGLQKFVKSRCLATNINDPVGESLYFNQGEGKYLQAYLRQEIA